MSALRLNSNCTRVTFHFQSARQYAVMSRMEKKVRERFPFKDYPTLVELEKRTALMLVNTDSSVDAPEPLQPNVIQIGGLQIVEPKPLPDVSKLKDFSSCQAISFQIPHRKC